MADSMFHPYITLSEATERRKSSAQCESVRCSEVGRQKHFTLLCITQQQQASTGWMYSIAQHSAAQYITAQYSAVGT